MTKISAFLVLVLFQFGISAAKAATQTGYYDQLLNPADPSDHRTFKQRYLINSDFASGPNAPVLYFAGNEGDLAFLVESAGFVNVMTQTLGAHLVALEHRYYGQSIPFDTLTVDTMKYLSMENALSDLASFQDFAMANLNLRGKWFVLGRSYGAALSTYYRELHPDKVVGSISAAPAIRLAKTITGWDEREAAAAGPECVASFHSKILAPIESAIQNHQSLDSIKALYDASDITADLDFLGALGSLVEFNLQMTGPKDICTILQETNPSADLAALLAQFSKADAGRLVEWTDQGTMDPKSSLYTGSLGMRQWSYQTCAEFGISSTIPTDPTKTFQSILVANYETDDEECMKLFGIKAVTDAMIDRINTAYYQPLLGVNSSVSNIVITNGSEDPTAVLSISDENGNNTNPKLTVFTVQGGAHHQELNTPTPSDPQSWKDARTLILNSIQSWLK